MMRFSIRPSSIQPFSIKSAPMFSPIDLANPVNSQLAGTGTAKSPIGQNEKGKVVFGGCWWSAFNARDTTIHPGDNVSVVGMRQNTLFVVLAQPN